MSPRLPTGVEREQQFMWSARQITHVMKQRSREQTADGTGVGPLDVQLAVRMDAGGCPLRGRDVDDIKQSVTRGDLGDHDTCRVAIEGGGVDSYQRTPVEEACPCAIFADHDCISELDHVRDGQVLFSLVVPDRETLRAIIDDLQDISPSVSLERIRTGVADGYGQGEGVALTEKQREALKTAIEAGYYDRPRGATLDDLAAKLDVTPSAVSQRLNGIERKLVSERASEFDLR